MTDPTEIPDTADPTYGGDEEERPLAESVEEEVGEKLGVREWDRPAIYRDTAAAATDADLPYWLTLILSGAIATLGLAIDSSAVVIGAMLVAPLLAPVIGLAMALAVGDGRLAIQTGVVVALSTLAVVATGALLTLILPFQTITLEISSRTRPTTLDLAIAVFSGLVGAVVTVARGHRLSAAIPGVAIAVALIPPLSAAGFGMGAGWNLRLIHGALLLYGANLGGIVLSGMLVFLLVGMHRPNVLEEMDRWHVRGRPTGVALWVTRIPWVRLLGEMRSPWRRVGLVLGFVVAVGVPLSETLGQMARERRVREAVEATSRMFDIPGRSSMVSRDIVMGDGRSEAYLRIATAEWFDEESKEAFERQASADAREPVTVLLEQILTGRAELDRLSEMPTEPERPAQVEREATPEESLERILARVQGVAATLPLPEGTRVAGVELTVNEALTRITAAYVADAPLSPQADEMTRALLERALAMEGVSATLLHVSPEPRPLAGTDPEAEETAEELARAADLMRRFSMLHASILGGPATDSLALDRLSNRLVELAGDSTRVQVIRDGAAQGIRLRIFVEPVPEQEDTAGPQGHQ